MSSISLLELSSTEEDEIPVVVDEIPVVVDDVPVVVVESAVEPTLMFFEVFLPAKVNINCE